VNVLNFELLLIVHFLKLAVDALERFGGVAAQSWTLAQL